MRTLRATVALMAIIFGGLLGATAGGETPSAIRAGCDRINLGEPRVFYKNEMSCRTAKTFARRVYRTQGKNEPSGFRCGSGSKWETGGRCDDRRDPDRYFGWYPFD